MFGTGGRHPAGALTSCARWLHGVEGCAVRRRALLATACARLGIAASATSTANLPRAEAESGAQAAKGASTIAGAHTFINGSANAVESPVNPWAADRMKLDDSTRLENGAATDNASSPASFSVDYKAVVRVDQRSADAFLSICVLALHETEALHVLLGLLTAAAGRWSVAPNVDYSLLVRTGMQAVLSSTAPQTPEKRAAASRSALDAIVAVALALDEAEVVLDAAYVRRVVGAALEGADAALNDMASDQLAVLCDALASLLDETSFDVRLVLDDASSGLRLEDVVREHFAPAHAALCLAARAAGRLRSATWDAERLRRVAADYVAGLASFLAGAVSHEPFVCGVFRAAADVHSALDVLAHEGGSDSLLALIGGYASFKCLSNQADILLPASRILLATGDAGLAGRLAGVVRAFVRALCDGTLRGHPAPLRSLSDAGAILGECARLLVAGGERVAAEGLVARLAQDICGRDDEDEECGPGVSHRPGGGAAALAAVVGGAGVASGDDGLAGVCLSALQTHAARLPPGDTAGREAVLGAVASLGAAAGRALFAAALDALCGAVRAGPDVSGSSAALSALGALARAVKDAAGRRDLLAFAAMRLFVDECVALVERADRAKTALEPSAELDMLLEVVAVSLEGVNGPDELGAAAGGGAHVEVMQQVWLVLVLVGFQGALRWRPAWAAHLPRIAAVSPVLVKERDRLQGPSASSFSALVLERVANPSLRNHVASLVPKNAKAARNLTFAQCLWLLCVYHCEALRMAAGSFGDVGAYLSSEIVHLLGLSGLIEELTDVLIVRWMRDVRDRLPLSASGAAEVDLASVLLGILCHAQTHTHKAAMALFREHLLPRYAVCAAPRVWDSLAAVLGAMWRVCRSEIGAPEGGANIPAHMTRDPTAARSAFSDVVLLARDVFRSAARHCPTLFFRFAHARVCARAAAQYGGIPGDRDVALLELLQLVVHGGDAGAPETYLSAPARLYRTAEDFIRGGACGCSACGPSPGSGCAVRAVPSCSVHGANVGAFAYPGACVSRSASANGCGPTTADCHELSNSQMTLNAGHSLASINCNGHCVGDPTCRADGHAKSALLGDVNGVANRGCQCWGDPLANVQMDDPAGIKAALLAWQARLDSAPSEAAVALDMARLLSVGVPALFARQRAMLGTASSPGDIGRSRIDPSPSRPLDRRAEADAALGCAVLLDFVTERMHLERLSHPSRMVAYVRVIPALADAIRVPGLSRPQALRVLLFVLEALRAAVGAVRPAVVSAAYEEAYAGAVGLFSWLTPVMPAPTAIAAEELAVMRMLLGHLWDGEMLPGRAALERKEPPSGSAVRRAEIAAVLFAILRVDLREALALWGATSAAAQPAQATERFSKTTHPLDERSTAQWAADVSLELAARLAERLRPLQGAVASDVPRSGESLLPLASTLAHHRELCGSSWLASLALRQAWALPAGAWIYAAPVDVALAIVALIRGGKVLETRPGAEAASRIAVLRACARSLEQTPPEALFFYIPQLVQALRHDSLGLVSQVVLHVAAVSPLFAHQVVWNMRANMYTDDVGAVPDARLKPVLDRLVAAIVAQFGPEDADFYRREFAFFDSVTAISGALKPYVRREKWEKKQLIDAELQRISVDAGVYLPSNPECVVVGIDYKSGRPLQSAAKAPFMATFRVQRRAVSGLAVRSPSVSAATALGPSAGPAEFWQSAIFKVGDDCRQDLLALQVIAVLKTAFEAHGIGAYLFPYRVVATAAGCGVIELIPRSMSRGEMGAEKINSLYEYFVFRFGGASTPAFHAARVAFVRSMAAYSVVCYLLALKDRHNGNIMVDDAGHILHIDFGFILDIAPGGITVEAAPFKLTSEMLQVMGGKGDDSPFYAWFRELCAACFLAAREHAHVILALVEAMIESGFPCFRHGGENSLRNMRTRFALDLDAAAARAHMMDLVAAACESKRTNIYDMYQFSREGIPY